MTAISDMRAPNHGGTPAEMLNALADFLDRLNDGMDTLVFRQPGHQHDGKTLTEIIGGATDERTIQADVRWLAQQLGSGSSGGAT